MLKWVPGAGRLARSYLVDYSIAVALGGAFGHWAGGQSFRIFSPNWLSAIFCALAGVFFTFALRNPHLLRLIDLNNLSPLKNIWKGKPNAQKAKNALLNEFRRIEELLFRLMSSGRLEQVSYRDQMDLAFLLCSGHTARFWATSLDRWSTFLQSNETYVRQMMVECSEHIRVQAASGRTQSLPGHARLFVLPIKEFLDDIIHAPTSARILVKHHLQAWKVPLKLLLHDDDSFAPIFKKKLVDESGKALDVPVIPDFMVVDSQFVYGRSKPDRVEGSTVRGPEVDLAYSRDPKVVSTYENAFQSLWESSLDVRSYCAALELVSQGKPCPSTPIGAAVSMTLEALDQQGYSVDEKKRLFKTLVNLQVDLRNFFNGKERAERYSGIPNAEGTAVVEGFLPYVRTATGAIFAIDQADIKDDQRRFWETWEADEDYRKWSLETQASSASPKQRVFVLRGLEDLDGASATAFILDQVRHNVALGFILDRDLQDLASGRLGDGQKIEDPSKAGVDSDFILTDVQRVDGDWKIVSGTRGFEVSYDRYKIKKVTYDNSLLCQERMEHLLGWYLTVWPKCLLVESKSGMEKFWQELRSRRGDREVA